MMPFRVSAGAFVGIASAAPASEPLLCTAMAPPPLAAADALHGAHLFVFPYGRDFRSHCNRQSSAAVTPPWLDSIDGFATQTSWDPAAISKLARMMAVQVDTFRGYCGRWAEIVPLCIDWPGTRRWRITQATERSTAAQRRGVAA